MKATSVAAKLENGKVSIAVTSAEYGEEVTREMFFQFEDIGEGVKMLRITDEALQDLVAFVNEFGGDNV